MIPPTLVAELNFFKASVAAANPVASASALTKAALVTAGNSLIQHIDAALAEAAGALDAPDPSGSGGQLVQALMSLATAANDQMTLSDMRGYVGRAVFNLAQV